ncbi:cohesin domain-containing protein [Patescibacteria group bacterium]|nr:cohesin domain-containing protein [Patescibacteria group bacterium]
MRKLIFTFTLSVLGIAIWSMPVLAATNVLFSSTSVNVKQGQNFTLTTSINPGDVKNYTVKLELNYPADILEVKSFVFASNWMPLSQSGYDLIDNTNGVLIKTAGYPSGISSTTTFGTISFSAKKAGTGTITLGGNSLALDSTNQNVLSGTPQAFVTIIAPAPATEEVVAPAPETSAEERPVSPVSSEEGEGVKTSEEEGTIAIQSEEETKETKSLLAAVGSIITFGTGSIWIGILVAIVILAILFYMIYCFTQKSRKKKIE